MVALTKQILGPSPETDRYSQRVGSALTPMLVSRILTECDLGFPARYHDLLNELRQKDPYVQSLFGTREMSLAGCGWSIQPAIAPGARTASRRAQRRAEFCAAAIEQCRNVYGGIQHLLDAILKGYSVCEVRWARSRGSVVPVELVPIAGRRWAFGPDHTLRYYDEGLLPPPGRDVLREYPGRFLSHTPRVNGDLLPREGLGRLAVWYAAFRTWAWRDLMLFAELYGKPITRVAYDRERTQTEDKNLAENIAYELTATGRAIHPRDMDVVIEWARSTGASGESPSKQILDQAGDELALAVLGQRQTTANVTGGMGASGDVRENVRKDILESDARQLATTLREQLLRWMVIYEFGDDSDTPRWVFDTDSASNAAEMVGALEGAVRLGLRVPQSYAHDVLGIPAAMGDEPTLGSTT